MNEANASSAAALPARIANRYRVIASLGRGGMAHVYRVVDEISGDELALKQLLAPTDSKRDAVIALFEAEFHTLAQLSHPRVIEVYDYGLAEAGAFYTMELLDGGDLADRSPLPWREACALIYDVCSSLALLHSRRFVHRDISPRNIRCTRDGRAKLIDFGTMVPMGKSRLVAGTPAFIAPEVLYRSALDGRADLFSLGATLYYALTRRAAFQARDFSALPELWKRRPNPPSSFDAQIPAALDTLVLSLLSPDPAVRPRTAYEVMQRLSAIAGLEREESLVSQAYLSIPMLVARDGVLSAMARGIEVAGDGRGSSCILRAESGLGRSRMLDACVLEAKAHGALVLRASAGGASGEGLGVVQTLLEQLREVTGALTLEAAPGPELADSQLRALLNACKRQLVVIAVDDMHRCDVASASLLAALAAKVEHRRLYLAVTVETGAAEIASEAMAVLSSYAVSLTLQALTRAETEELLSSVFGTVPNLGVLTKAIDELAHGNPRKCLDLAQHFVDHGVLRYALGGWTLPEQIEPSAMPRSAEDAMHARIAALDPLARSLAQANALCLSDGFSRDDYVALRPEADNQSLDHALLQLLAQQILVKDGAHYALARRSWTEPLTATLAEHERKPLHVALARLHEQRAPVIAVHHWLASDQRELGVSRLFERIEASSHDVLTFWQNSGRMRPTDLLVIFENAHRAAIELHRPARDRIVLAGWLCGMSIIGDDDYYRRFVDEWRTQLEHDSGLDLYRGLTEITDPGARLMRALTLASERYEATPEHERAYRVDEAIRILVLYVGVSIAIGSRAYDRALLSSLPAMLEPFDALAPVLVAVRLNAIASCALGCDSRLEQARALWLDVYQRLLQIDPMQLPAILTFRNAVANGLGLVEARIGLDSAISWADLLDRDPTQRVNAMYLRKVVCLHHGDFEGAEYWRKQAELAALQAPMRQMFTNVVLAELWAHAAAGDLVGVKQALERIVPLSERYPGWRPVRDVAEAQFEALRGDLEAACAAFERGLEKCTPDPRDPSRASAAWPSCMGGYIETLRQRGRYEQACEIGERALALCDELDIGSSSHEIVRAVAMAEAQLGDFERAWGRLERVVDAQTSMGVKGLQLGLSYEACTRVAIWAGDAARLQRYAHLTALEYRHGRGSPLGARYERLMEEARGAGLASLPELTDLVSTALPVTRAESRDDATTHVVETMIGASDWKQRAERALRMLCGARNAKAGQLYLCTASGIEFAAAEGALGPSDDLREFLARFLHIDYASFESETSIATEADAITSAQVTFWSDASGNVHRPLVLHGVVDGTVRPIGIASFIDSEEPRPVEAPLCSAIAAYLIDAGDVRA